MSTPAPSSTSAPKAPSGGRTVLIAFGALPALLAAGLLVGGLGLLGGHLLGRDDGGL